MAVRSEARSHPAVSARAGTRLSSFVEIGGYSLIAIGLTVLLLLRVRHVDAFYLDEWLYTQGADHMWANLPLGPIEQIPNWTRGPQRLYTWVLALFWGPLGPSTAFSVSHVMNVLLLVSAVWPAALIARRTVEAPALRVLAVGLAVAIPWLVISANLLTENLAFPIFLWTFLAIVVAAENPRASTQLFALAGVTALTLCRLNLVVMFGVLVLVVLATELRRWRDEPGRDELLREALRRQRLLAAASFMAILGGLGILLTGGSRLGAYGQVTDASILDAVWGPLADDTGRAFLTYLKSLATGSFIFPVLLGLGASFAGATGRLGRTLFAPGLTAVASLIGVIAAVSIWNVAFGTLEERYVFYVYSPLAIIAVAGIERFRRMLPELIAMGVVVTLAMAIGLGFPGVTSGSFFAAPGGAFWSRVIDHRLRGIEEDLLGWLPAAGEGWLIVAVAIFSGVGIAMLLSQDRRRATRLLAVGLSLCVVAQVSALDYDYSKLLYGTPEFPGGLAASPDRARDRDDWIDKALPTDAEAAIVPAVTNPAIPYGDAERQGFWNETLTGVVALRFAAAPVPAEPGIDVVESTLEADGLASWRGPRPEWFVAQPDDPRVQFPGRRIATSRWSPFAIWRTEGRARAIWTASGLDSDGALLARRPGRLTLDRARTREVRAVSLFLRGLDSAVGPVTWELKRVGTGEARSGRLEPRAERTVTLPVPACHGACAPVVWRLEAKGTPTQQPPPYLGPVPPSRPVMLQVLGARLDREAS